MAIDAYPLHSISARHRSLLHAASLCLWGMEIGGQLLRLAIAHAMDHPVAGTELRLRWEQEVRFDTRSSRPGPGLNLGQDLVLSSQCCVKEPNRGENRPSHSRVIETCIRFAPRHCIYFNRHSRFSIGMQATAFPCAAGGYICLTANLFLSRSSRQTPLSRRSFRYAVNDSRWLT